MNRFYDSLMSPAEALLLKCERRRLIPKAENQVLELGAGTGINLNYYDWKKIENLTVTDLAVSNRLHRRKKSHPNSGQITIVEADAENLPFADASFDSVVFSLLFCTVGNVNTALTEIKRVLKPEGEVFFIEHELPKRNPWRGMFNIAAPLWKLLAGGCRLNRQTVQTFRQSGFKLSDFKNFGLTFAAGVLTKREKRYN